MIRAATPADAAAICAIWNPVIRDTLVTFNPVQKTPDDITAMIADKAAHGFPFLVAQAQGALVGFATYGQFRGGDGYRHTAEHTIILGPAARGQGLGRRLMDALCDHARAGGMHSLWAGCSAANPEAIAFHTAIGFQHIARLPQVGYKFDTWIDLILLQKML